MGGAFVGRDGEVAQLQQLADSSRVVTVVGVGGIGKTRLVAETAPGIAAALDATCRRVDLAYVPRRDDLTAEIAGQLGFPSWDAATRRSSSTTSSSSSAPSRPPGQTTG